MSSQIVVATTSFEDAEKQTSRKLASVQRITDIRPIPGADNIVVASVLGWQVVIKKDDFQVGDLCIYCEIDSILPPKPEFDFLKERKYRIKTIRLRKQISQGICFPLSILPESEISKVREGVDVTEALGIEKFIPYIPENLRGKVKGNFPTFMPKTDETRIQILQNVLTRHKGVPCYITEKLDGTSVTYYLKDGVFGVCSRNYDLEETEDNLYWKVARMYKIEEKLRALSIDNMAIQGEIIGNGVQKNPLRLEDVKVFFFNVFDIKNYRYHSFEMFLFFIKDMGLETVPILSTYYQLEDDIQALVAMSQGFSVLNKKVLREGIVIRPLQETLDMEMSQGYGSGRLSFKAINPEYLLKYEE